MKKVKQKKKEKEKGIPYDTPDEKTYPYARCCGGSIIKKKGGKCPICGDTWN